MSEHAYVFADGNSHAWHIPLPRCAPSPGGTVLTYCGRFMRIIAVEWTLPADQHVCVHCRAKADKREAP